VALKMVSTFAYSVYDFDIYCNVSFAKVYNAAHNNILLFKVVYLTTTTVVHH